MSFLNVFDVAGSAMNAQSVRLNTIASNMANADSVASRPEDVYKAKMPVFETMMRQEFSSQSQATGVRVKEVIESEAPALIRHDPGHPMADEKGNVYAPNVNVVEEMANMMSASRSYQNNVEVFNTSKQLLMQTINLGR